jgi:two-component system, OmpR family, response regulator VicR
MVKDTIIIASNEPLEVKGLKFNLEQDGYKIDAAYNREEILEKIRLNHYALAIIDMVLPDIKDIYRIIKEEKDISIIILKSNNVNNNIKNFPRLEGDYITRPFNMQELESKINAALLKRPKKNTLHDSIIKLKDITIDLLLKRVDVGTREIKLSAKEYSILLLLAQNKNRVYSRENLMETIWGNDYLGDKRIIDVHIRRLREKLESNPENPLYIITKWGIGYYFNG